MTSGGKTQGMYAIEMRRTKTAKQMPWASKILVRSEEIIVLIIFFLVFMVILDLWNIFLK